MLSTPLKVGTTLISSEMVHSVYIGIDRADPKVYAYSMIETKAEEVRPMTVHRVRTVKVGGKCYCRCVDTNETAVATNIFSAYQQLNRRCGCKHKAHYDINEAQRRAEDTHFMRVAQTKQVGRRTISQLNAQVEREYRR